MGFLNLALQDDQWLYLEDCCQNVVYKNIPLLWFLPDAEFSTPIFCTLSVSVGFKNLGTLKGNLDREAAVVENCRVFQSSALGGGGPLEILVLSFAEEGQHVQG